MTIDEIKQIIHDTVDTNTSDFSNARMVRQINIAQDDVVSIILENDGAFEWDEEAYGDLNEGTLTINAGQKAYNLAEDENFANILSVIKGLCKDAGGNWYEIKRFHPDYIETSYDTFEDRSGTPTQYRLSGKKLLLYPTPNTTISNGLKIFFIREPKPITVNDTTRELSIPSIFHKLVAYKVAYNYAVSKRMDNKNDILNMIFREEEKLGLHMANQDRTVNNRIIPVYRNPR